MPVSNFGVAVAARPNDPRTAWLVPAVADQKRAPADSTLAVTLKRDGGKTFEARRTGLPQLHWHNCIAVIALLRLIYRHGLEVAGDGRTLIMDFTSGWRSNSSDAGDMWQTISTLMLPIYAVTLKIYFLRGRSL